MKNLRKISAVLLALSMMLACTTAFAADTSEPVDEDSAAAAYQAGGGNVASPNQTIGKLLTGGAANFYGSGTLDVYLSSGNAWADIQAGTGGSTSNGWVTISVMFPTGDWYELGTIRANADHTSYKEFLYCPAGTYHFVFENTNNDWIQVYANIYD